MASFSEEIPANLITQEEVDSKLQCGICLEYFKISELVRRLICQHIYHGPCILPWLEQHNTCPTCRMTVGEEVHHNADEDSIIDIEFEESIISSVDSGSDYEVPPALEGLNDWVVGLEVVEEYNSFADQSDAEENSSDRESLSDYVSNSDEDGYSNEDEYFIGEVNDEENSSIDVLNYSDNEEENCSDDERSISEDSPSRESISFVFTQEDSDERQSVEEDLSDRVDIFDADDCPSNYSCIESDEERYSERDGDSHSVNIIELVDSSDEEEELQPNNEIIEVQNVFDGEETVDVVTCSDTHERSSISSEDNRVLLVDLEEFSQPQKKGQNTKSMKSTNSDGESFVNCLAHQSTGEGNHHEEDSNEDNRILFVDLEEFSQPHVKEQNTKFMKSTNSGGESFVNCLAHQSTGEGNHIEEDSSDDNRVLIVDFEEFSQPHKKEQNTKFMKSTKSDGESVVNCLAHQSTGEGNHLEEDSSDDNRVLIVDFEEFSQPHKKEQNTKFMKSTKSDGESVVNCLVHKITGEGNNLEEEGQDADEAIPDRNIVDNQVTNEDMESHSNGSTNPYMHIQECNSVRENCVNVLYSTVTACLSEDEVHKQLHNNDFERCSNEANKPNNNIPVNVFEPCRLDEFSNKIQVGAEKPIEVGCSTEVRYYNEKHESSGDDCSDRESIIFFRSHPGDKHSGSSAQGTSQDLFNPSCQNFRENLQSSKHKMFNLEKKCDRDNGSDLGNTLSIHKLVIDGETHSDRDSFVDVENNTDEESVVNTKNLSDKESDIDVEILSDEEHFIDVDNYSEEDFSQEARHYNSDNTCEKDPIGWDNNSDYYSAKIVNSSLEGRSESESLESLFNSENYSNPHSDKMKTTDEEENVTSDQDIISMGMLLSEESLSSTEEQSDEVDSKEDCISIGEVYSDQSIQIGEEGLSYEENYSGNKKKLNKFNSQKVGDMMCSTGIRSCDTNVGTTSEEQYMCGNQKLSRKVFLNVPVKNVSEDSHCIPDTLKRRLSEDEKYYLEDGFSTRDQNCETEYSLQSEDFLNKTFCGESISGGGRSINVIPNYHEPLHNDRKKESNSRNSFNENVKNPCDRNCYNGRKKTVPILKASVLVKSMVPKLTIPHGKLVLSGKTGLMKKKMMLMNPLVKTLMKASAIMRKSVKLNKTSQLPKTCLLKEVHQIKNTNEAYDSYFSKETGLIRNYAVLKKTSTGKNDTTSPRDAVSFKKKSMNWKVDMMGKFHFILKANMIDKSVLVRKNILLKKAILWRRGVLKTFFPIMKASFSSKNVFPQAILSANVTHLKNDVRIWRTTLSKKPNLSRKVSMTSTIHVMSKITLMKKTTAEKSSLRRFPIAAKDLTLIKTAMLRVAALIRKTYLKKTVMSIKESPLKRKSLLVHKNLTKKRKTIHLNNSIRDDLYVNESNS